MDRRAPLIGFDSQASGGVRFRIARDGDGEYRDWDYRPTIVTDHIPGSNIAVSQYLGTPPVTVTWRLEFDDVAMYRRFRARLATTGTLTILAGFSSAQGVVEVIQDYRYEHLDGVQLMAIEDVVFDIDGIVSCAATFQRAMDPVTGLAVRP